MFFLPILISISLILIIFLLTNKNNAQLFLFFFRLTKSKKVAFYLISFIFFPGTLLHEFSHFFTALIFFLKVKEIRIFPEFKENQIKLGEVLYEKKDFLRSVFVGLAPFFWTILTLFFISYFKFFPAKNLWQNIIFGYLLFSISSTMFFSKQDLVDIGYLIPFSLLILAFFYIFNIEFNFIIQNQTAVNLFLDFIYSINYYLFLVVLIHLFLAIFLKIFSFFQTNNK